VFDRFGGGSPESRLNGADAADRGVQTRNVEGVRIERRFACANIASPAPVQTIPKADHHQFCVLAAERQSHEPAVALIKPIVISGVARQIGYLPARLLEFRR
jgi:hypothetical protein